MNSSTNEIHADSIHELLRNETGATINRGDAVYISGYSVGQDRALVTLADNDSATTMPSVALVEESSIDNNETGEFIELGTLADVDTSPWSVGDTLWVVLAATSVAISIPSTVPPTVIFPLPSIAQTVLLLIDILRESPDLKKPVLVSLNFKAGAA